MIRRPKTRWTFGAIVAILAATWLAIPVGCMVFGIRTSEEASYQVLRQDGNIELREYDDLVVAETTVKANFEEAGRIAFNRLFSYISGANASQEEIAMTAPVMANPGDTTRASKIPTTAPILSQKQEEGWRYMFVLPATYTKDNAPAPSDPSVRIVLAPRTKVAALRYSGSWNEEAMDKKSLELLAWVETHGLVASSAPRAAGYDPPWTIPFLRRNEVLIDVE